MTNEDAFEIRELEFPGDNAVFMRQLKKLYTNTNPEILERRFQCVRESGWACIGAFFSNSPNDFVGISGFSIQHRFAYGKFLYVDHFIVSEECRGRGVGTLLYKTLEKISHVRGCQRVVLDALVTNTVATRFWFNNGFYIEGFHFGKAMDPVAGTNGSSG